jgi:hypothetical protein
MAADIHLMDALNIRQADLAGFDWGARRRISSPRCGRSG